MSAADRAADERVERQPEADDERCAAEVSHASSRPARVYLLGHFVVSAVATNAPPSSWPVTFTSRPVLNRSGTEPW